MPHRSPAAPPSPSTGKHRYHSFLTVDPASSEGHSKELLDADAAYSDRLSLFAWAMATNPRAFAARRDSHRRIVQERRGTPLKELADLAVTVANDYPYWT